MFRSFFNRYTAKKTQLKKPTATNNEPQVKVEQDDKMPSLERAPMPPSQPINITSSSSPSSAYSYASPSSTSGLPTQEWNAPPGTNNVNPNTAQARIEIVEPRDAETSNVDDQYVVRWMYNVFEFCIILSRSMPPSSAVNDTIDMYKWYRLPPKSSRIEYLEDWTLSCIKMRFAIERTWEYLYESHPRAYKSVFDLICRQGRETRIKFASLVVETMIIANIIRFTSVQHKSLTNSDSSTLYIAAIERRFLLTSWFQQKAGMYTNLNVESNKLHNYKRLSLEMISILQTYPPELFTKPLTDNELNSDTTVREKEDSSWIGDSLLSWFKCCDSIERKDIDLPTDARFQVMVNIIKENIGGWIIDCPNRETYFQARIQAVVFAVASSRLSDIRDTMSRRKKPPMWVVTVLNTEMGMSIHKLKTLGSICKSKQFSPHRFVSVKEEREDQYVKKEKYQ